MNISPFSFFVLLIGSLLLGSCRVHPKEAFSASEVTAAPDYRQDRYWAALPWTKDAADLTPNGLTDEQDNAKADVFFIHLTTYVGKSGEKLWNGPVRDAKINERTQAGTIQFQASIFNGVGRVFAPYYRQAHLHAYFTEDTLSARRAFDLAYNDVRQAFQHYLKTHNRGRPIIIAAHSQGTTHAIRLLQEFFDGKKLKEQLVAAYIVGIKVEQESFAELMPCQDSTDIGCYTSWRTFKRGYEPKVQEEGVVVTNPLLWTTSNEMAPANLNMGAVIRPFEKVIPAASNAQVYGPILWASKPKFNGSWLLMTNNYHAGDFNIFYMNVRENAALRTDVYLDFHGS
jgi:hypothetical protein